MSEVEQTEFSSQNYETPQEWIDARKVIDLKLESIREYIKLAIEDVKVYHKLDKNWYDGLEHSLNHALCATSQYQNYKDELRPAPEHAYPVAPIELNEQVAIASNAIKQIIKYMVDVEPINQDRYNSAIGSATEILRSFHYLKSNLEKIYLTDQEIYAQEQSIKDAGLLQVVRCR